MVICIACNILDSIRLTTYLQFTDINDDMEMFSFDIDNIYTNIPKSEVINRTENK
jgi:hypothetical protein